MIPSSGIDVPNEVRIEIAYHREKPAFELRSANSAGFNKRPKSAGKRRSQH
jgi:hypothetical protein